jgi:hypothetical protein
MKYSAFTGLSVPPAIAARLLYFVFAHNAQRERPFKNYASLWQELSFYIRKRRVQQGSVFFMVASFCAALKFIQEFSAPIEE